MKNFNLKSFVSLRFECYLELYFQCSKNRLQGFSAEVIFFNEIFFFEIPLLLLTYANRKPDEQLESNYLSQHCLESCLISKF